MTAAMMENGVASTIKGSLFKKKKKGRKKKDARIYQQEQEII